MVSAQNESELFHGNFEILPRFTYRFGHIMAKKQHDTLLPVLPSKTAFPIKETSN